MARKLIETVESRASLAISILILLVLFVPNLLSVAFTDRTPPIVSFSKAEALNSPIRAGEPLLVRIWREKVRDDCTVHSDRQAVNQDGVVFDMENGQWRGGSADNAYLDFAYPTSLFMPVGIYELRVHLAYTCPNVPDFHYDQPPVRFRVINTPKRT